MSDQPQSNWQNLIAAMMGSKPARVLAVIAVLFALVEGGVSLINGIGTAKQNWAKGSAMYRPYIGLGDYSDMSGEELEAYRLLEEQKKSLEALQQLSSSPDRDAAIPIVKAKIAQTQKVYDTAHIARLRDGKGPSPTPRRAVQKFHTNGKPYCDEADLPAIDKYLEESRFGREPSKPANVNLDCVLPCRGKFCVD